MKLDAPHSHVCRRAPQGPHHRHAVPARCKGRALPAVRLDLAANRAALANLSNPWSSQGRLLPYGSRRRGYAVRCAGAVLHKVKQLDTSRAHGQCFDDWGDDAGGGGASPGARQQAQMVTSVQAARLVPGVCRAATSVGEGVQPVQGARDEAGRRGRLLRERDLDDLRPAALKAHDLAPGRAGQRATPPFVMRALYGRDRVRIVAAVRHPVDRLETSYAQPLRQQVGARPRGCTRTSPSRRPHSTTAARRGARRCAYMFELIERKYGDVFFHCDQIIRGLYEPFVADRRRLRAWRCSEDLLDQPAQAGSSCSTSSGCPASTPPRSRPGRPTPPARSSLRGMGAGCAPTRASSPRRFTRRTMRLAALLGRPALRGRAARRRSTPRLGGQGARQCIGVRISASAALRVTHSKRSSARKGGS